MHFQALIRSALAAALVWSAALLPVSRAADPPADTLRQKNDEVERLKRELERAEKERDQLRQDNERLRQQQEKQQRKLRVSEEQEAQAEMDRLRQENQRLRKPQDGALGSTPIPSRELKPVPPIRDLPPLADGAVVEVDELVGHFLAEPGAAAQRYADRNFRVQGEVDRFTRGMVTREFAVLFVSPERRTTVKCRFNYVDQYRTVFPAKDDRVLTARYESGREIALLEIGQQVTIAGECQGLKDGMIVFRRCAIVR